MPACDDDAANQNRASRTQTLVREPTTNQRQIPNRRNVGRVDRAGIALVKAESAIDGLGCHVERQQRAHAVVAEALPHFSEEQSRKSPRMSKETAVVRTERSYGSSVNWCAH